MPQRLEHYHLESNAMPVGFKSISNCNNRPIIHRNAASYEYQSQTTIIFNSIGYIVSEQHQSLNISQQLQRIEASKVYITVDETKELTV
jgi:hypothetical protein